MATESEPSSDSPVDVLAHGGSSTPALLAEFSEPTPQDIAVCAYLIWESLGCPNGHADEHWRQAEAQLRHTQNLP